MATSVGNVADSTGWLLLFRRTNGTLLTWALSAVTILVRRDAVELVWNVNVTLIETSKVIVLDFQLCPFFLKIIIKKEHDSIGNVGSVYASPVGIVSG